MHRIHQKFESPIVDAWVELILHQKSIDYGNWWERLLINLYFLSSLQFITCQRQIWCMISDSQDSVSWNQDTNFQVAKNIRFYLLTLTWLYITLNQTPRKNTCCIGRCWKFPKGSGGLYLPVTFLKLVYQLFKRYRKSPLWNPHLAIDGQESWVEIVQSSFTEWNAYWEIIGCCVKIG